MRGVKPKTSPAEFIAVVIPVWPSTAVVVIIDAGVQVAVAQVVQPRAVVGW